MSFIRTIEESEANEQLAAAYAKIAGARGGVANVMKIHSLNPSAMMAHFELYKSIQFRRNSLSRVLREMIGVVVSAANGCDYCVAHHSEPLFTYRVDEDVIRALGHGDIPDSLEEKTRAMLAFAQQITTSPGRDAETVARLRAVNCTDQEILDATLVAAYFNFVNRIVETLGVELEPDFAETCSVELGDTEGR